VKVIHFLNQIMKKLTAQLIHLLVPSGSVHERHKSFLIWELKTSTEESIVLLLSIFRWPLRTIRKIQWRITTVALQKFIPGIRMEQLTT